MPQFLPFFPLFHLRIRPFLQPFSGDLATSEGGWARRSPSTVIRKLVVTGCLIWVPVPHATHRGPPRLHEGASWMSKVLKVFWPKGSTGPKSWAPFRLQSNRTRTPRKKVPKTTSYTPSRGKVGVNQARNYIPFKTRPLPGTKPKIPSLTSSTNSGTVASSSRISSPVNSSSPGHSCQIPAPVSLRFWTRRRICC